MMGTKKPEEAPRSPPCEPEPTTSQEHFERGVLTRGEAAKPDEKGELPPGATHEIVEEEPGKLPKLRRRRFSIS
jgi:hypothetical protein